MSRREGDGGFGWVGGATHIELWGCGHPPTRCCCCCCPLLQLLYREWLLLPPSLMTVKEAVLLIQRLAYVQDRCVCVCGGVRWKV